MAFYCRILTISACFWRIFLNEGFSFILEYLLKVQLTVVDKFHSHLEPLDQIHEQSLDEQVSKLIRI